MIKPADNLFSPFDIIFSIFITCPDCDQVCVRPANEDMTYCDICGIKF